MSTLEAIAMAVTGYPARIALPLATFLAGAVVGALLNELRHRK
jgi:hypothetical protein